MEQRQAPEEKPERQDTPQPAEVVVPRLASTADERDKLYGNRPATSRELRLLAHYSNSRYGHAAYSERVSQYERKELEKSLKAG